MTGKDPYPHPSWKGNPQPLLFDIGTSVCLGAAFIGTAIWLLAQIETGGKGNRSEVKTR